MSVAPGATALTRTLASSRSTCSGSRRLPARPRSGRSLSLADYEVLVRRRECPEDGRGVFAELTDRVIAHLRGLDG
ncbi:hypothetical protein GCM10010185_05380 [Saccharothrix coeruleofusca]|uniref:Uncharacterized protein n=1 Tax=Saccharothrix coeruleofusca TaxID=33919 RepID=A0A918AH95_9PSEU|nr:hypothetical protein GCM10010185_05380 [Saccharothrix coeruleofusca]